MKAIQITDYGTPAPMHYTDAPDPQAGAGELLIGIRAIGVNPLEIKMASGAMRQMRPLHFPWTPGLDVAGVVESVGEGVTGFNVGDEVYGKVSGGAYAEKIAAPAALFAHKPATLSFVEAASIATVIQTAWQSLFTLGDLQAGQRVLIHGASGGVGTLAVQLAHWKGAKVIATTSPETAETVRELGADEVLNSRDLSTLSQIEPVDLLLDAVGLGQPELYGLIRRGGRFISITLPTHDALAAEKGIQALKLMTQGSRENLEAIAPVLEEGVVKPQVFQTFPLAETAAAWGRQMQPGVRGKIVLVPDGAEQ